MCTKLVQETVWLYLSTTNKHRYSDLLLLPARLLQLLSVPEAVQITAVIKGSQGIKKCLEQLVKKMKAPAMKC